MAIHFAKLNFETRQRSATIRRLVALCTALAAIATINLYQANAQQPKVIQLSSPRSLAQPRRDFKTQPATFELSQDDRNIKFDRLMSEATHEYWDIQSLQSSPNSSQAFFENQQLQSDFARRVTFTVQDGASNRVVNGVYPVPLKRKRPTAKHRQQHLERNPEYIYDGSDRDKRVQVDADWNIYGLETEDTIGHFDTVDGRRLVSPSNRVAIYAPRFSAVRRVDNLQKAALTTPVTQFKRKEGSTLSRGTDFSSSTKQNVALVTNDRTEKSAGFRDRTRGVTADNVVHLTGSRGSLQAYENLELMKWGKHSAAQTARLEAGIQSAKLWQDNLGVQAFINKIQPVVVNDVLSLQQTVLIESDQDNAVLSVTKIANKAAASPGEEVEFTIRFDNISGRRIGNVTLVDNLTGRLQYIANSAQCSLDAKFVQLDNDGGSLLLRWEIDAALPAGKGGIIRFKCRVR